jgi:hypothetical protein
MKDARNWLIVNLRRFGIHVDGPITGISVFLLGTGPVFTGLAIWDAQLGMWWQAVTASGIATIAVILESTVFYGGRE